MRAAMQLGVEIPKLCATDNINSFGSCRLCLVEIEGRNGLPASCTTPVAPGISVKTMTPRLDAIRRGVIELYISDHPLDCLTCAANGDCELQKMAGAVSLREVRYGYEGRNHVFARHHGQPNDEWTPKDQSNPYFTYDPSKCIVCNRCVRACQEVQGTFALTIEGRGFDSRVAPGAGEAFMASECVSCGACVQACPTATLIENIGDRDRPARTFRRHHLRLLRRRLRLQGRDARRGNRAHGPLEGRQGEPRAQLHQGPLRLWLCAASRPRSEADDPREDQPIHGAKCRGRRRSATPRRSSSAFRRNTGGARSAASPRRAAPMRRNLPRAETDPRRLRQQQHRHLRARLPFADRLRAEPGLRHVGGHAGFRFGRRRPTSCWSSAATRPTRILSSARK